MPLITRLCCKTLKSSELDLRFTHDRNIRSGTMSPKSTILLALTSAE
jgi:hypothetical protein